MARHSHPSHSHLRESIAQLAARLMAEGIQDFALAKRKAARQLGAADTQNLPNNSEIEQALRTYQALYQREHQVNQLSQLRAQALQVMGTLARFDPLLTGSVLRGTATPYSDINLLLFADSQKEVELYLLNRDLVYKTSEKRFRFSDGLRPVPVLHLSNSGEAEVQLAILSIADRRQLPLSPVDGLTMKGARMIEVQSLLDSET
jgi:hypothetical protein